MEKKTSSSLKLGASSTNEKVSSVWKMLYRFVEVVVYTNYNTHKNDRNIPKLTETGHLFLFINAL